MALVPMQTEMSSESIQSQNKELLKSIELMFETKLIPITKRLTGIEESLCFTTKQLEEKIPELEKKVKNQEKKCDFIEEELKYMKIENQRLKEEVLKQEMYSRRNNIKLYGITCPTERLEEHIVQILSTVGISLKYQDIVRVHYLTPPTRGPNRPILLQLFHWKEKKKIMDKKDSLKSRNVIIQEDYPILIQERRKKLLPVFFKALELYPELNPKFYTDRINIGGTIYTAETIDTIKFPELLPERVFSPVKAGIQAYFSKYSPLSNFYQTTFKVEDKIFKSAEQYFVYKKALHFEDKDTAQRVIQTSEPEKLKKIGKSVQGFQKSEWHRVATEYMYQAVLSKFSQNDVLKGFLLSTSGNVLVEASASDKFWGIGLSIKSPDLFNQAKWTGKNMAGKTLERVRHALQTL